MIESEEIRASDAARPHLAAWLDIPESAKPKIYEQICAAAAIDSLTYWLEIFFSAGIAAFGLVESSPAVIIGAMLISPLMAPIMGMGLALAVGDLYLGIKAVLNLLVSVVASIAFSGFLVWLLPFHSATAEIIARTNPNLLDLGIALLCGLAGSVVVCRGGGEAVTALPGVAIAVALMPPLCTVGFGLGGGFNLAIMGGGSLLFLTNLVAIVASAFLVFLLVGLNTEEVRKAMAAPRKNESLSRLLSHGPVTRMLTAGGQLRWRIVMIVVLLASVAVPLRRALLQVARETGARGAVQDELKRLVPTDALVSQQVSVGQDEIVIRLISTKRIPDAKVAEARADLMRRTGRDVQLSVEAVASTRELTDLVARLAQPAQVVVARETSVDELQKKILDRVGPAVKEIWPSSDAPIQELDVVLNTAGIVIDVRYQATTDLGKVPINMVLQSLRTKLGMPDLTLKAERIRTVRSARDPRVASEKR